MATLLGFTIGSALASQHLLDGNVIAGGYCSVDTIAERDALPKVVESAGEIVQDGVIKEGSMVYVKETGKLYVYIGDTWREQPDNIALESLNSNMIAIRSYIEAINNLQTRVSSLEQKAKNDADIYILTAEQFTDGVWSKTFLPDHERLYFCTNIELSFKGTFSDTTEDSIVINNQIIQLGNTHEAGVEDTTSIRIERFYDSLMVYCNDIQVGTVRDSVILTIQINALNINDSTASLSIKYTYAHEEYSSVNVRSKNGFPVTENFDGEIEYWERACTVAGGTYVSQPHALASHHSKAVYSIGNYTGSGTQLFFATTEPETQIVPKTNVVRYIYMANWDLSRITGYGFMFAVANQNAGYDKIAENKWMWDAFCKRLDFSKVIYGNLASGQYVCRLTSNFMGDSMGSLQKYGNVWRNVDFDLTQSNNQRSEISKAFFVKSFGDLSDWDVSRVGSFAEQFSMDFRLEFVGDIANWKVSSKCTLLKNMFRSCFALRGISSGIMNWDTQNVTQINGMFGNTFYIGDNTLYGIGKWDTGKCLNFNYPFCYFAPQMETLDADLVYRACLPDDISTIYANTVLINSGTLTDTERRQLELQNLSYITNLIVDRKTDLSFVEKWDVSSGERFMDFFAFNPYLTNVGDLRAWELNISENMQTYGFRGFLQYCTALETIKMPSIPAGANVGDFARGCTRLANIEIDELNNSISFEDCPLTKQSVLNLIDAATTDVDITLKSDVYTEMIEDADVQSAINTKAGSNIIVNLGTI